jgi:hypothetical protein
MEGEAFYRKLGAWAKAVSQEWFCKNRNSTRPDSSQHIKFRPSSACNPSSTDESVWIWCDFVNIFVLIALRTFHDQFRLNTSLDGCQEAGMTASQRFVRQLQDRIPHPAE